MLSILFSKVLWLGIGTVALLLGAWWMLYERYFHPAWRKERRLVHACKKAFGDGAFELVRVRFVPHGHGPSGVDFYPAPIGHSKTLKYFTYQINVSDDTKPDFSDATRREKELVRRYLRREVKRELHHGREVLQARQGDS